MKNTGIPQPKATSKIVLVAAVAKNNVIGNNNDLPWHYPEELKWFKDITWGRTILMGRKTFESILRKRGKPLENRKHIVLSKNTSYQVPGGVFLYHDLNRALADFSETIYIIGGGEIYFETIDLADEMYITHIDKKFIGDVVFPDIKEENWQKEIIHRAGELNLTKYLKINK